jgi:hypothetical protein
MVSYIERFSYPVMCTTHSSWKRPARPGGTIPPFMSWACRAWRTTALPRTMIAWGCLTMCTLTPGRRQVHMSWRTTLQCFRSQEGPGVKLALHSTLWTEQDRWLLKVSKIGDLLERGCSAYKKDLVNSVFIGSHRGGSSTFSLLKCTLLSCIRLSIC